MRWRKRKWWPVEHQIVEMLAERGPAYPYEIEAKIQSYYSVVEIMDFINGLIGEGVLRVTLGGRVAFVESETKCIKC